MLNREEPEQFRESDYFRQFLFQLRKDKLALTSVYLFIALLLLVFFGHAVSPYQADTQFVGFELMPPSWDDRGQISHFSAQTIWGVIFLAVCYMAFIIRLVPHWLLVS